MGILPHEHPEGGPAHMNAHVPRAGRLLVLALAVGLARPAAAPAQAPAGRPSVASLLRQADELYRADKLPAAETLYRQALDAADGLDRVECFDRLLAIYVRVGRQDQAVRTGLQYRRWLAQTGDAVRARELDLDLGGWYLALGHAAAAEPYLQRALQVVRGSPLPPARQVTALTRLARAAEKQGNRDRAGRAWREVETFARAQLDDPRQRLDPPQRIELARRLADSYRFQGRPAEAVPRLEGLLPLHDAQNDPAGRRDTLRALAGHLTDFRRFADAVKCLNEALDLHARHGTGDRLTRADLEADLADVHERRGRPKEAGP